MTDRSTPNQPRPLLPGDFRGTNPDNPARSQAGTLAADAVGAEHRLKLNAHQLSAGSSESFCPISALIVAGAGLYWSYIFKEMLSTRCELSQLARDVLGMRSLQVLQLGI